MKRPPQLIGLCGAKGSGKSTIAATLPYLPLSFATPIKQMLMAMGLTYHEVYDSVGKEIICERFGKTPRHMMQTLGTEWGRQMISDTIWIDIAQKQAEDILARGSRIVFDDVRFDDEASMIRSLGGVIWKIQRGPQADAGHLSEAGVSDHYIDKYIFNSGSKAELRAAIYPLLIGGTS